MNIEELINKAADTAIKKYLAREKKSIKKKTFHNTELLLIHYNDLKEHCKKAKYDAEDIQNYFGEDIKINNDELYIKSIMVSKLKTQIMIEHIDLAIKTLEVKMNKKKQPEKFEVIKIIYFNGKSFEDAAAELHCSVDTIRRWKNEMTRELSIYLFGVDGLKMDI